MNKFSIIIGILSILSCIFTSCSNNDDLESPYVKGSSNMTILLYAVASNNLENNLHSDKSEILSAASSIDLNNNNILIYEVTNEHEPRLLKLAEKRNEGFIFETVREYDSEMSSLDPQRIHEVISHVTDHYPSNEYGLILWSHGTGWDPYFSSSWNSGSLGVNAYSFGYDRHENDNGHEELNIDVLADAIPDGVFDFIWFDACYMSGIELIYELRNKCNYFIGYPTEVFEWGMDYSLVLPYLAKKQPDYIGGARAFFNYYAGHPNSAARVATVAVIDMSKLEQIADLCKIAYSQGGFVDRFDLVRYSRGSIGPFYDFGAYTLSMAASSGVDFNEKDWTTSMNEFVVYKNATPTDFKGKSIPADGYSGISCHIYDDLDTSAKEQYYRSLDWYKRVYSE